MGRVIPLFIRRIMRDEPITIYGPEKVLDLTYIDDCIDGIVRGIEADNLLDALSEEIEEGRALFKSRVAPELFVKGFYDRALIDIIVRYKGHVASKMW